MLLAAHLNAIERALTARADVQSNTGHPLHKGNPREEFIREFLSSHLAATVDIGTGEIIDAKSKPKENRHQIDAVIYRRDYPKLDFSGGISGFLVESVVSTIEIKSRLDREGVIQAVGASRRIKQLTRNAAGVMNFGPVSPIPKCFIVAYDGPSNMGTVQEWIKEAHEEQGAAIPKLPSTGAERLTVACPGLDGVFVLKKGFVHFDNLPFGYIPDDWRAQHPDCKWVFRSGEENNLLILFLALASAISSLAVEVFNPSHYAIGTEISNLGMGP